MSSLTRRLFAQRLFVGAAAASLPATAAIAAARSEPIANAQATENAALVALGERIDPLLAAYRAAVARRAAALAEAEVACPAVPDELWCKRGEWQRYSERESDVEGAEIVPPNYIGADGKTYGRPSRRYFSAFLAKEAIRNGELHLDRRTREGKQLSKMIETSWRYETEREAVILRSGVLDAADEVRHAALDVERLAYEVRELTPVSMAGLLVVARALSAHAETEIDAGGFHGRSGTVLGRELASGLVRLAGGAGMV